MVEPNQKIQKEMCGSAMPSDRKLKTKYSRRRLSLRGDEDSALLFFVSDAFAPIMASQRRYLGSLYERLVISPALPIL